MCRLLYFFQTNLLKKWQNSIFRFFPNLLSTALHQKCLILLKLFDCGNVIIVMCWLGSIVISERTRFQSTRNYNHCVSACVLFLALKMFSSVRTKLQRKHSISRKRQKQRDVKFVWNRWQLLFWGVYCRERSSVFPVAQKSHRVNTQTSKGGQVECKPMIVQLFSCRFQNVLLSRFWQR